MSDDRPKFRSAHSYGKLDKDGFIHRSWMKAQGYPADAFDGRPVIGICNTWSEITPCNSHLREIADYVKRGVWEAGGLPLEFPAMSLGETQMRPTAMLFRNLLAMEVEESIRGNPLDGVVLLGGCDKTTPGQILGAASVDLPTIVISSGPMLNGKFRGRNIGSGTDVWKFSEAVRAGEMSPADFFAAESGMSRSRGTCNTMGSASSFAAVTEALGIALKYNATIPAVDANRQAMSHQTGRRIVELVRQGKRLSHFLTREAFENAIRVHAAIGGSTNTVIHLLALAGRVGIDLTLQDFDDLAGDVPLLANIMPSGEYLMEDLHYAGGMPAVMTALGDLIHRDVETVGGQTMGEQIAGAEIHLPEVIATPDKPFKQSSGIWVLRGNIAPDGAIIKPSAASPGLLRHRGKAVVFETIEDLKARIDDPDLDVDASSILVLKGCGPKGYPGMPEVGNMPLPRKLLEQGVTDMVRISDARMSGTAYGTVVLHTSPETSVGGPLGLVETGDEIELDAAARTMNLLVSDAELARRAALRPAEEYDTKRGYVALHRRHVLQAHLGADLDFLVGKSGDEVKRESH
ncbi:MAG: dihydroxy-acid dehydratase [Sphingomonadaceae bacterium]|nr:dihydroxy-acid dehydratase [Sphingomonadaceae bacterium]